ncbi:MAG: TRAP transporter large permease [Rhizobiaceae bacterium]
MLSIFIIFALLRVPVCVAMGIGALVGLSMIDVPHEAMVRYMLDSVRSIPLLAIPFFILAAAVMNETGLTARIFKFASALVGFTTGGLAQVNILSSVIFSGISGSALADISGLGSVQVKAMTEHGYSRPFSAAVTIASATIGPIIPPSIIFIIYAVNTNVSIGELFVAGVIPGLVIAALLMATVWVLAKTGIEKCPPVERSSLRMIAATALEGAPAIVSPIIIIAGMVTGIVTATEAAVLAVIYSLALGLAYRELNIEKFVSALQSSIRTTALIMYLTGIGSVIAFVITWEQAAAELVTAVLSISSEKWISLLLITLAILVLGCVLETVPALLICIPLFAPAVADLGIDPVHFGVMLSFNLLIGIITPPIGLGLYAICATTGLKLEVVIKSSMYFFPTLIIALLFITYLPFLSTWLPSVLFE